MSGVRPGGQDPDRVRPRDRRRVRWPVLAVVVLLGLLLALTTQLERSAPVGERLTPVEGLARPLLDAPVRCTRADDARRIAELRAELRPDGRLTSAIATACPRLLDGVDVVYVGEVVGDVLRRDGGAWVHLNDDAYALTVGPFDAHRARRGFNSGLAVWLPDGLHEDLAAPGGHGRRGDVVRVTGVLRRADPDDAGGLTVRASTLEVVAPGVSTDPPLNTPLVTAAGVAAAIALGSWGLARRRARGRAR